MCYCTVLIMNYYRVPTVLNLNTNTFSVCQRKNGQKNLPCYVCVCWCKKYAHKSYEHIQFFKNNDSKLIWDVKNTYGVWLGAETQKLRSDSIFVY